MHAAWRTWALKSRAGGQNMFLNIFRRDGWFHSTKGEAAMAKELVRNEWGVILQDAEVIELRWLPSTASMSDGGFMATLCLFAWKAEKARPLALLIDALEF